MLTNIPELGSVSNNHQEVDQMLGTKEENHLVVIKQHTIERVIFSFKLLKLKSLDKVDLGFTKLELGRKKEMQFLWKIITIFDKNTTINQISHLQTQA